MKKTGPTSPPSPAHAITSATNATFKRLISLTESRGIRRHNEYLVHGAKFCEEILKHAHPAIRGWIRTPSQPATPAHSIPEIVLNAALFRQLDIVGTDSPILLMQRTAATSAAECLLRHGCHLVLPLQNPDNIGGAIRSGVALGVSSIGLTTESAEPFLPRSLRAAGPAILSADFWQCGPIEDAAENPLLAQLPLFCLDRNGTPIARTVFPNRFALIVGTEGPGLPASLRSTSRHITTVSIPIQPQVESLNAHVAIGIALYEWQRQRTELATPTDS